MTPFASSTNRKNRTLAIAAAAVALLALTGCSNISGLGGTSEFGCKAPVGVPCMSVSGVHENERAGNLPSQRPPAKAASSAGAPNAPTAVPASDTASSGFTPPLGALRSDPTVIRIWVAPWEDTDGDLVDQAYVYLLIDSGRWLIEHNREAIRRTFAPRGSAAASVARTQASTPAPSPSPPPSPSPAVGSAVAATPLAATPLAATSGSTK